MTTVPGTNGVSLTDQQRYALAINAGFTGMDAVTATAISIAENPSGLTNVLNDNASTGDYSIGPWQINLRTGANNSVVSSRFGYTAIDLANPFKNADAAHQLFSSSGFSPWTTYLKGSGGMPWTLAMLRAVNASSQVAANSLINPNAIADQLNQVSHAIGGNANTPSGGTTSTTGGPGGISNPQGATGSGGNIFNTTPGLLVVFVAVILLVLGAIIWGKMFSIQGPKTIIQLGPKTKTSIGLPSIGGNNTTPTPKPVSGYTRTRMVSPHTYHTRTVIVKHK